MSAKQVRKLSIDYWWRCDALEEIPQDVFVMAEEAARERVFSAMTEGYTSGEIIENVLTITDCPEDGWEIKGWFGTEDALNIEEA